MSGCDEKVHKIVYIEGEEAISIGVSGDWTKFFHLLPREKLHIFNAFKV